MNAAMAEVIAISGRMPAADYEAERARIRDTWGDASEEAKARRDQALAALFYRSGWTQEELAKNEGGRDAWKPGSILHIRPTACAE